ncbi:MAG: hypothetical protein AAF411_16130 [Myxococcota bacterium]
MLRAGLLLVLTLRAACLDSVIEENEKRRAEEEQWNRPEDPMAPLDDGRTPPPETASEHRPAGPLAEEEGDERPEEEAPQIGASWNDDAF